MDGITEEHNAIQQQYWPKHIDFEGLKAGADNTHEKHEGDSFPHLDFAHGPDQGLFGVGDHFVENEGLLIFWKVLVCFLFDEVFGCEIADDELQDVEKDEISDNVVGQSFDAFEVQQDEHGSDEPTCFFIEYSLVDE